MTVMPLPPVSSTQPMLPWGETPARTYAPGMGQAVADRTINRRIVRRLPVPKRVPFEVPRDDTTSLESQLADVKQCSLEGHADHILATRFLKRFVGDAPWIHVDLSGSSCKGGLGGVATDVTGFGVAWGIELLRMLLGGAR